MPERNERPIFEGKERRMEDRRAAERRKSQQSFKIFKYAAAIVFLAAFVLVFSL